jgi:hypothetical protein
MSPDCSARIAPAASPNRPPSPEQHDPRRPLLVGEREERLDAGA